jgi:methyl-accepting chemotaxis protein
VGRIEKGSGLVNRAGETMDEILVASRGVADIVAAMSDDLKRQMASVRDAGESMDSLGHLTRRNASLLQGSVEAADHVVREAEALTLAVAQFRLENDSQAAGHAPIDPKAYSRILPAAVEM